ncbi:O-antigen ligase family protein [Mediterraneibacter glycyrrhizinilyticus]|nr:O-antigen ligase family protein [Mediterraneibacter glycyrrhizinilyticus]MBM6855248.1 O-antigen ligase family protein [Mediterraneibacter glycyrrhizinilyticus]
MKISVKYIKYVVCLLPFLLSQTVYAITNNSFSTLLLGAKLLVFLYYAGYKLKKHVITKFDFALFLYFFTWLFSLIINDGDLVGYLKEVVVITALIFILEYSATQMDIRIYLNALTFILFIMFLINFIAAIFFPSGLWETTSIYGSKATYMFLGLGNQITPMFLLALLTLFFQVEMQNIKFAMLYSVVLLGNIYYMSSATAIVGSTIMIMVYIVSKAKKYDKLPKWFLFGVLVVGIGIVLFRIQYLFSFLIEDILGKSLNLSNRTVIWDRALVRIAGSPIFGYGIGTLETIIVDRNAHCFFLQLLLQSGIIGLAFYINIFRISLKDCLVNVEKSIPKIVLSCICGYLVCCITEVYAQNYLLLILCIAYHRRNIEEAIDPIR